MQKSLFFILFCLCLNSSLAIQATRGRAQINETNDRAQLSIIIQVIEEDYIPEGTSLEKEIVEIIKDSLRLHLPRARELKKHNQFSHVFVSLVENSLDERVLAIFTKTPKHKKPFLHILKNDDLIDDSLASANLD